jgi:hypothetical protein
MQAMRNRVKQIQKIIDEKVVNNLMIDENVAPKKNVNVSGVDTIEQEFAAATEEDKTTAIDLLEDALSSLHYDRDLSSLLLPKLKEGCEIFLSVLNLKRADNADVNLSDIRESVMSLG